MDSAAWLRLWAGGLAPVCAAGAPLLGDRSLCVSGLFLQLAQTAEPESSTLDRLQSVLEARLGENPHYRYAVGLGQARARSRFGCSIPRGQPGWEIYQQRCLDRGQKLGNIKPGQRDSDAWTGWADLFGPLEAVAAAR